MEWERKRRRVNGMGKEGKESEWNGKGREGE